MYQMLYGTTEDSDNDVKLKSFRFWIELAYRSATYAIVSYWIDEKSEDRSTQIRMRLKAGNPPVIQTEEIHYHQPMPKPKRKVHQRGMKRL